MADYTPYEFHLNIDINLDKLTERQLHKITNANLALALERGIQKGLERLEFLATERLQQELSAFGLGGSNIASNISIRRVGDDRFEINALGYVVYLEYGTGIVGATAGTKHPDTSSWDGFEGYDINGHGLGGWWYPTDDSDPNPYKKIGSDGVLRGWTAGQIPKPFIHNTWRYVRQAFDGTITKAIEKEINKELGL